MGRINHHAVDNGDVEVYSSYYPSKYTTGYIPDIDNTLIYSITDDDMEKLLELFH